MRRSFIAMLVACSLFTFCSCEKKLETTPESERGADSQDLNSEDISDGDSRKTQPDSPDTEYANTEKVFIKDFDGFIMTIVTDKSEYRVGESIRVTASLENTRDEAIYLAYGEATMPSDQTGRHYLIELRTRVHIADWYKDPPGPYWGDTEAFSIPVQPGEKHVQSFLFQPCREIQEYSRGLVYPDLDNPAAPGVYDGNFFLLIDQEEHSNQLPDRYDLDFSVTIKDSAGTHSDTQDTEPVNAEKTFVKDIDGIVMTIETSKSEYLSGESVRVTASLENTRDEDIYLWYPATTRGGYSEELKHYLVELEVNLEDWYKNPPDPNLRDDLVVIIPVHPGEKHVQSFIFQSYSKSIRYPSFYPFPDNLAGPGVYDGNFFINICKPDDTESPERYDLNFTVTIK